MNDNLEKEMVSQQQIQQIRELADYLRKNPIVPDITLPDISSITKNLEQSTNSLVELSSTYSERLKIFAEQMNESAKKICELYKPNSLEIISHLSDNLVYQYEALENVPTESENKKSISDKEKFTFDKVISMIITIYNLINILCTILGTTPLEVRNDIFEFIEHLIVMNNKVCIEYELPEYSITENINQLLHQEEYKETQKSF